MDILDTVREMKPTYPTSPQAPRRALHQAIAQSRRRRPLGRIIGISLAGTAVAAVAVAASVLIPPGVVGQPPAASASTYLNETAASIRSAAAQPVQVTMATRHLRLVGGRNEQSPPFGSFRTDATGAVVTESAVTYLHAADGSSSQTSHTELHATETYGDATAVHRAWTSYYGSSFPIGAEPLTVRDVDVDAPPIGELPVSTTDFPSDPAAFLAAWMTGMEDQLIAAKAEAARMPMDGEPESNGLYASIEERLDIPAAEHMLNELGHSVPILSASPEYRATFLEALALADGMAVENDASADKILVYETDDARFRLTVNPPTGSILRIEKFLLRVPPGPGNVSIEDTTPVEVGSASFLPKEIPDFAVTFTTEPVG